jgi:hypothetical protein
MTKKTPSFHIRDMDKAVELLKKWGYELKQPSFMDALEFQVVGTNLYIRGYPSRQAHIDLEWEYTHSDYNLFQRLKQKFWNDHVYFKKLLETLK